MAKGNKKTRKWLERLRTKYKLVLMHDKTFEVQASLRLSPLNVIILSSTLFVVIGFLVYLAIVFTPLKNLVVGYSEVSTTRQIAENNKITDSMLTALRSYEVYFANLQKRLNGEIDTLPPIDSLSKQDYSDIKVGEASEIDKAMREQVAREDLFNLSLADPREKPGIIALFSPCKGNSYCFIPNQRRSLWNRCCSSRKHPN